MVFTQRIKLVHGADKTLGRWFQPTETRAKMSVRLVSGSSGCSLALRTRFSGFYFQLYSPMVVVHTSSPVRVLHASVVERMK